MSIAAQCSDCCSCPTPTVEWDSVSANLGKVGWAENTGYVSTPPKRYFKLTRSSGHEKTYDASTYFVVNALGVVTEHEVEGGANSLCVSEHLYALDGTLSHIEISRVNNTPASAGRSRGRTCGGAADPWVDFSVTVPEVTCDGAVTPSSPSEPFRPAIVSATVRDSSYSNAVFWESDGYPTLAAACAGGYLGGSDSAPGTDGFTYRFELSDEYTTTLLKTNTAAALPAYDDDWNDTAGSFANLSADELSYAIRQSRYRIRFKIPQVRTGKLYRITWVERFIPEAGVGIDSVEVYSRGVYRPAVTLSGGGGSGAVVVALMASDGSVSGYRILNPGSGYTSAPAVAVAAAINGGTTATATATINAQGQLAAVVPATAGNYHPTLAFSGGGGTGATATCTVDETGGIDAVALSAAGSGYTSAPTLAITSRVSGSTAADILLHLGTETPRCAVWDGITPGGYDPATPSTYPIIGDGTNSYWSLDVPASDGTTLVANVRAVCDGTACP